jgi:hypothetical protein
MLSIWGCVEKSTELTEAERDRISAFIGDEAPSPEHELGISFENKIELLGYDIDIDGDSVRPGQAFEVTWHWHCKRPLEDGWRAFTHFTDARGEDRLNQDNEGEIRQLYPPGRWKAGEYIRDVQRMTLPADWNSNEATIYLGLWNGPHRLQVTDGPSDGDNRARALRLDVAASTAPTPEPALPSLVVRKTAGDIVIDGKLDEDVWGSAAATGRLVNTMNGAAADPETTVKLLWNDDNLYIAFEVKDDQLRSSFQNRDDHLWEQDTVEVMVDPDGDGQNYFELQVSPRGVTFETRYDTQRQPQPFGHVDWNPEIEAAADVNGTIDDENADEGYTVELRIPWTAFVNGDAPGAKPEAGGTWRMNFFVMDARTGDAAQRAAGWSPPRVGDFHTLNRFGRVTFGDETGAVPAGVAPANAPGAEVAPGQLQLPARVLKQLQQDPRGGRAVLGPSHGRDTPSPGEAMPTPTMAGMGVAAPSPSMAGTGAAAPAPAPAPTPTMAAEAPAPDMAN